VEKLYQITERKDTWKLMLFLMENAEELLPMVKMIEVMSNAAG